MIYNQGYPNRGDTADWAWTWSRGGGLHPFF